MADADRAGDQVGVDDVGGPGSGQEQSHRRPVVERVDVHDLQEGGQSSLAAPIPPDLGDDGMGPKAWAGSGAILVASLIATYTGGSPQLPFKLPPTSARRHADGAQVVGVDVGLGVRLSKAQVKYPMWHFT